MEGQLAVNQKSDVSHVMSLTTCLIVMSILLLSGCATMMGVDFAKPIALNDETKALDIQKESVALLTVRTSNQYKPGYQPYVWGVLVVTNNGSVKKETYRFGDRIGRLERSEEVERQYNEYLISFSLPAGKYKLRYIDGTGGVFPVQGRFAIPVFADFDLTPNKIVYLGKIEATLRERKNNEELRSGSVFPLIDQAATGFYSGTFDINIYDNYEKDVSLFKEKYLVLNGFTIEKTVLAPWKQPTKDELKN